MNLALGQRGELLDRGHFDEGDVDAGKLGAEDFQHFGQEARGDLADATDPQLSAPPVLRFASEADGPVDVRQDPARLGEEDRASIGQGHAHRIPL